ncbi:MAG: hypothetical protein CL561_11460 [Alphaproteobacteria bacterium]|nr:hypothetical protein [Alphaproteobacteria bacterium]|tara:strand:+ start:1953 stop:2663 length:711 start_codon:yes stop_codon:yes gene_type:complete
MPIFKNSSALRGFFYDFSIKGGYIVDVIISIIVAGGLGFCWAVRSLKKYSDSYFREKGKNLASKEDIAELTRIARAVEAEVRHIDRVEERRYELKYQACMDALEIVDSIFCHLEWTVPVEGSNGKNRIVTITSEDMPTQTVKASEVRRCHSNLQITCKNKEVLDQFNLLLFGGADNLPMTLLKFRKLIKEELQFEGELPKDERQIWFSGVFPELKQCKDGVAPTMSFMKLKFLSDE